MKASLMAAPACWMTLAMDCLYVARPFGRLERKRMCATVRQRRRVGLRPNPGSDGKRPAPTESLPRRFFASIPIESERAGLEVARIMDGLLVELTRTQGSNLRLTLEIDGTAEQGYPKDVVETVKANGRDLKLDEASFGFEED